MGRESVMRFYMLEAGRWNYREDLIMLHCFVFDIEVRDSCESWNMFSCFSAKVPGS